MQQFLLFLFFAWIPFASIAQTPVQKDSTRLNTPTKTIVLGPFMDLKVYSGMQIKAIQADENKIVIHGDHAEDVVATLKNNTLKLRYKLKDIFTSKYSYIELFYKDPMDRIGLHQGSQLDFKGPLKQTSIQFEVQEGSKLNVEFFGKRITSKIATGGQMNIYGECSYHNLKVTGGGYCEAETLQTEQTDVHVTAGGVAYVNATDLLNANVTVGGTIRVHGKPKKLITEKRIGGQIIEMQ
ncbi:MAG: GIN domain-containing protein [Flavobacteriaceae bacterium]